MLKGLTSTLGHVTHLPVPDLPIDIPNPLAGIGITTELVTEGGGLNLPVVGDGGVGLLSGVVGMLSGMSLAGVMDFFKNLSWESVVNLIKTVAAQLSKLEWWTPCTGCEIYQKKERRLQPYTTNNPATDGRFFFDRFSHPAKSWKMLRKKVFPTVCFSVLGLPAKFIVEHRRPKWLQFSSIGWINYILRKLDDDDELNECWRDLWI